MSADRRRFLRLAGLGTVAAVAACTDGGRAGPVSSGPSSVPSVPPVTSTTRPPPTGPPDWAALRARLGGDLLLPGDGGYDAARAPFNSLFAQRRPAAVARCAAPADVQACVEVARKSGTPLAARSGGHSYAGYSTPEQGLVVDLARLAAVQAHPDGTATVQAGAKLIDVYAALAAQGRALPGGSCPTVGIGGLTLGGGQGVLTRLHGLTCDRLRAADVVLADSSAVTVAGGDELFWALRGGGGGNFGIVTAFTFETVPAPDLTVLALRFPAGSVPAVLAGWQEWIGGAPNELWSNCVVSAGSPPTCRVGGCFAGSAAALNPLVNDLVRRVGTAPTARTVTGKGYLDAMRYFAGCSTKSVEQCQAPAPATFVGSSRMLARPLADPAAIATLLAGRRGLDLLFDSLGGAVRAVAADATAFPHRDAVATVQVYAGGADPKPVAEVQAALASLAGAGAYVNYLDPGQQDWAQAYYGANLSRLRAAAAKYDPDRVFAFAQGLTSA